MSTSEILFDPFLPEVMANPYPSYHRLRAEDPVHLSPLGFWVLTRYGDCVMVLREQRFGRAGFEGYLEQVYGGATEEERMPRSMLFRDPPDHTRAAEPGQPGVHPAGGRRPAASHPADRRCSRLGVR